MKKSAFISDILFAFIAAFLPTVCYLRYLRLPMAAALLFAAASGILVALPVWVFLDKKRDRLCLKKRDEEEKNKLLLHLALCSGRRNAEYFRKFFIRTEEKETAKALLKEETALSCGDRVDATDPIPSPVSCETKIKTRVLAGLNVVETKDKAYFPLFTMRPADGDSAAAVVRAKTNKQKCLLCGELSPEAEKLCARFDIRAVTGNDVYFMLKKEEFLPANYLCDGSAPLKRKRKPNVWFAKGNSRHFLLGGILILLTSFITPFPFYYLIFGSALILAAVFVRIFGYR